MTGALGNRHGGRPRQAGFTLVEAVVTIVITAIVAAIVTVFIRQPVTSYFDTVRRAELTDAADGTLRRVAREVRTALPNSIRVTKAGGSECVEFLPTVGSGRYRELESAAGTGIKLDFTTAISQFDVLQSKSLPPAGGFGGAAGPYYAVIYNLGIPGADAYEAMTGATNRAQIAAASAVSPLTLATPNQFPFRSPYKSFQVIPAQSVIYSWAGDKLLRSTRPISSSPLASCPDQTSGVLLMSGVRACHFDYTPAVSARNGVLGMTLELGDAISLYEEIHVNNTP